MYTLNIVDDNFHILLIVNTRMILCKTLIVKIINGTCYLIEQMCNNV